MFQLPAKGSTCLPLNSPPHPKTMGEFCSRGPNSHYFLLTGMFNVHKLDTYAAANIIPVFKVPDLLMVGVVWRPNCFFSITFMTLTRWQMFCKEDRRFLLNNKYDADQVANVVEVACKEDRRAGVSILSKNLVF